MLQSAGLDLGVRGFRQSCCRREASINVNNSGTLATNEPAIWAASELMLCETLKPHM